MSNDTAQATDGLLVGAGVALAERPLWHCEWDVHKWDEEAALWALNRLGHAASMADFEALGVKPYEVGHVDGNLLTTAGLGRLTSLLIGGGGQALTLTASRLGVGNGAAAAVVADTDLGAAAGSANRWFNLTDATYPTAAGGLVTLRSTFASGDGNFAWNEFGLDIGAPTVTAGATVNALLLNHKTSIAQGTKASGQVWTATATITIA